MFLVSIAMILLPCLGAVARGHSDLDDLVGLDGRQVEKRTAAHRVQDHPRQFVPPVLRWAGHRLADGEHRGRHGVGLQRLGLVEDVDVAVVEGHGAAPAGSAPVAQARPEVLSLIGLATSFSTSSCRRSWP